MDILRSLVDENYGFIRFIKKYNLLYYFCADSQNDRYCRRVGRQKLRFSMLAFDCLD